MIEFERYSGKDELGKLLKMFVVIPTNTEIVEKTGVSKGSVSEIMSGKRKATRNFIDKFKKGFNIVDDTMSIETKKPQQDAGVDSNDRISILINENEFLKETIRRLLETLNK